MPTFQGLVKRAATFSLLVCASSSYGCGSEVSDDEKKPNTLETFSPVIDLQTTLNGKDPVVWSPESVEDQRKKRDTFSWAATNPLPVPAANSTDPAPVYYAEIYIRNADELRELEEMGIHYDAAPLFESEWPDTTAPITMEFQGDPKDHGGQFVYALLPAITYNLIREATLAGEDTYVAINLRPIPFQARALDGSVSYDYLGSAFGEFAPHWSEVTDVGETAAPPATEKRLGRWLRKFVRHVVDGTRAVVDGIRAGVGKVVMAFKADSSITVTVSATNGDPRFSGPMTRAWGATAGSELRLSRTRVNVTQWRGVALYRGITDAEGVVTVKVASGLNTRICIEGDSASARLEQGLLFPVRACSGRFVAAGTTLSRPLAVDGPAMHALAQLIDARRYATEVLGFTPPKAMVQRGWPANVLSANGRAYVPCLAATNAPSTVVDGLAAGLNGVGAVVAGGLPIGTLLEMAMATDIMLPDSKNDGRATATHEYGHFFLCSLLAQTKPSAYNAFWGQVTLHALKDDDSQVRGINEGFADWFASQAAGGVSYLWPLANGTDSAGDHFFAPGVPGNGHGLEENVGAPICGTPSAPASPDCSSINLGAIPQVIGSFSTLLHDVIDRPCAGSCPTELSDGAVWSFANNRNFVLTRGVITATADEAIQESPRLITEIVRDYASQFAVGAVLTGGGADFGSVLPSFVKKLTEGGKYTPEQVCKLLGLHGFTSACPAAPPQMMPPVAPPPVAPPPVAPPPVAPPPVEPPPVQPPPVEPPIVLL